MKKLIVILIPLLPLLIEAQTYIPQAVNIETADTIWVNKNQDSAFRKISGNYVFYYKPKFKLLNSSLNGGTIGQMVVKKSSTDFDWGWENFTCPTPSFSSITGQPTDNTNLSSALTAKQNTLISATNIKTINGSSILGSGDMSVGGSVDSSIFQTTYRSDTARNNTYAAINGKQASGSYLTTTGNGSGLTGLTKSQVGLANADNTSDANKPVSSATQTALNAKQDLLVSNTNIKTVGGQTLLGSGNIVTTNSQTFVPLAANFSSSSTTPAAITGWSFAVTSGVTYHIQVIGSYQTAATTTGGIIGISLTTATGTVRGSARGSIVSTAANSELMIPIVATSGAGSTLTTTGVTAINSPHFIGLDIIFTCTGTGAFNIVWGSEVNASAAQINQNSALIYQALN